MSSSKSRNFRRRGGDDENNDTQTQPKSNPPKPINSTTTPLSRSRLSFSDDGEDAVATPLKSTSNKPNSFSFRSSKTMKSGSGPVPLPPLPSNVKPQAGSYTPESLLELRKNTKSFTSVPKTAPREPVIYMKYVDYSDDDEGDEEELWEEEQARKGLGGVVIRGSFSSSKGINAGASVVQKPQMSISEQAEENKKAFFENLKMMEDGISKIKAMYERNDVNMCASLSKITSLENAFTAARGKFIFMQTAE